MRQRRPTHRYTPTNAQRRPRTNEQISVPEVLLVMDEGQPQRMKTADALALAREQELDLIEIAATANPPVVKIADFGGYLYQVQKKEKRQKSGSKSSTVKTIRLGFRTDIGDMNRLADRAREFLSENNMVKVSIIMRGRELTNKSYAADKLRGFISGLADAAEVDQDTKKQGNQFIVMLRPKK